jgi:hypothetical protein
LPRSSKITSSDLFALVIFDRKYQNYYKSE